MGNLSDMANLRRWPSFRSSGHSGSGNRPPRIQVRMHSGPPVASTGEGFSPLKRTQIDILHAKFHRNRSQSRSEVTDPSESVDVRVLAFYIRGANAPPFDPRSTDSADSSEVILAVFHECQVRDE